MPELKISISDEQTEEITTINVSGIVDALTVSELEKVLSSLMGGEGHGIILNLSSTEYISTAGWSAIISAVEKIRKNRGEMILANMVPNVQENYQDLEFNQILDAYESVKDAHKAMLKHQNSKSAKK